MASTSEVALIAIGLAYPFLVYFGLRVLPPGYLAIGVAVFIALRIALRGRKGREDNKLWFVAGAAVTLIVITGSPLVGLKAYPILMSLSFAAVFGYSLLWPPTVVERIARLRDPGLPFTLDPYLRKVTIAWLTFFIANASISAATALGGNLKLWTLYNGLLSYLIMGAIFAGEFVIRQRVHKRLRLVSA